MTKNIKKVIISHGLLQRLRYLYEVLQFEGRSDRSDETGIVLPKTILPDPKI